MNDNDFTPYRDRPPLDKGPLITWRDLESGMLFMPGVSDPGLRRVRGTPREVPNDDAYLIGSEDTETGRPCGGVIGTNKDRYRRTYLDDGRPCYEVIYEFEDQP